MARGAKAAPVLKWTGAKWALVDWIGAHLPRNYDRYCEPFFGSGAIFFSHEKVRRETVNDVDGQVANLYRVLRHPESRERLVEAVCFTPWAEEELCDCAEEVGRRYREEEERPAKTEPLGTEDAFDPAEADGSADPVERARQFLVVAWMGIGSRMKGAAHFRFAAGGGTSHDYPPDVWQKLPERIAVAGRRLAGVQITRKKALGVVRAHADERVLLYVDPPYIRSTRSRAYYPHEMTPEDHERLLAALREHPGAVVLSGYDHPLYRDALSGWRRAQTPGRSQRNAAARTEVLWVNDVAWRGCRASRHAPLFEA